MEIRKFKESDAEAMAKLSNANYPAFQYANVTPAFLKRLTRNRNYKMFVLDDKGLIGFCGVNFENRLAAELGPICVEADCRAHGLGKMLVDRVVVFLREIKPEKLVVKVKETNLPAQAFFKSLGFEKIGECTCGSVPALLMGRSL